MKCHTLLFHNYGYGEIKPFEILHPVWMMIYIKKIYI